MKISGGNEGYHTSNIQWVVKKSNGSIRLCADFSIDLNTAQEDYQYPQPIPEDI